MFDLSPSERQHLIDVEIKKYKDELTANLSEEISKVDDKARTQGVKYINDVILNDPKTRRIKADTDSIDREYQLYIDSIDNYNDIYYVVNYEVSNRKGSEFAGVCLFLL